MASTGGWREDIYAGEIGSEFDRGSSRFAHLLLFAVFGFFVFFIWWADYAELDEVTRGEGKVIPTGRIQKVQHLEGGIVSEILVHEGQIVDANDVVLRVENIMAAADLREGRTKFLNLLADVARLQAEADGKDTFEVPDEVKREMPLLAADSLALFQKRTSRTDDQVSLLRDQLAQKQQELVELRGKLTQLRRSRELAQRELDLMKPLVEKGVAPQLDLIRTQQRVQELDSEINSISLAIPRTDLAIREATRRIEAESTSIQSEAQQELSVKRAELNALRESLTAEQDRVTRTAIRSPVRGTVNKLLVNTIGGVVKPGEDLVEIVPLEDTLLVEAKIRPADRAELRPGLDAEVKVTAYDYSIYGGLTATLVEISPDTITDEEGNAFYRIRLRTEKNSLGPDKPIVPGMTASVDILTGKKSVLDYIMKPINKARQQALRER